MDWRSVFRTKLFSNLQTYAYTQSAATTRRRCRDPETAVSPRQATACPVAGAAPATVAAAAMCRQGGSL